MAEQQHITAAPAQGNSGRSVFEKQRYYRLAYAKAATFEKQCFIQDSVMTVKE